MTIRTLFPGTLLLLALGCASSPVPTAAAPETAVERDTSEAESSRPAESETRASDASSQQELGSGADRRQVGDHVSFRIGGSFRKAPLVLSQRVVSRDAESIGIDYQLDEPGKEPESLRVTLSTTGKQAGRVLSVRRVLVDGSLEPADLESLDALLAKTVVVADQNEAWISEGRTVIEVDGARIDALRSSYRVVLGGREATLSTLTATDFPWGDLGGELRTASGELVYEATLVRVGASRATAELAQDSSARRTRGAN